MRLYDVYKIIQKKEFECFYKNLDKKNKIKFFLSSLFIFALAILVLCQLGLCMSGFLSWFVVIVTALLLIILTYMFERFMNRNTTPALQKLCSDLEKELNIVIFENDNKVVRRYEN